MKTTLGKTVIQIGDLIVSYPPYRIIEPITNLVVAEGFSKEADAIAAAHEMNGVADWFGVIKTRAQGGRPNCQDELSRIARSYGAELGTYRSKGVPQICAEVVAHMEKM